MKRRTFLASLGTALVTSGCLASTADEASSTTPPGTDVAQRPGAGTPDDDAPATGTRTTTPGPRTTGTPGPDPFSGVPCPSLRDDGTAICSHAGEKPVPVVLRPERPQFAPSTGDGSVETLGLTLGNASSRPFAFDPMAWRLDRYDGERWSRVAVGKGSDGTAILRPDTRYRWSLSTQTHPTPAGGPTPVVAPLGTGIHAFSVVGTHGEGGEGTRYECLAVFEVIEG